MRRWARDVRSVIEAVLARSSSGLPTVLLIEGEVGFGKSALLADLVDEATKFSARIATGFETSISTPYDTLGEWGAEVSDVREPHIAAQRLRDLVHEQPTLLVLDDLQWADPESLRAVISLVSRSQGDRLLVAVATRPLGEGVHPDWQRWVRSNERVERLSLEGLDANQALALIHAHRPELDESVALSLWRHTRGNPLQLVALTSEFTAQQLRGTETLSAPEAFARSVAETLRRLDPDDEVVARALSVLSDRPQSLLSAAIEN
jgi:hypothetical protein